MPDGPGLLWNLVVVRDGPLRWCSPDFLAEETEFDAFRGQQTEELVRAHCLGQDDNSAVGCTRFAARSSHYEAR